MEKVNFDPFLTICGPFSSRAKIRENMAERAAGDRKPPLTVRLGHSEGWKPPKVGGFRWKKCPRKCNSGPLARDTAILRFLPTGHAQGPKRAHLGSSGHHFGGKRVQTWPKADPNVTQLYSVHQQWQPDLPRRPMEAPRPVFGILGHFWPQNFSKCPGGQDTAESILHK